MSLSKRNKVRRRLKEQAISKPVPRIQRAFSAPKDGKAVIATETPIEIYDAERRQMIR